MHRLQFGKNCADENLCLDPKNEPFGIVGNPDRGATKFLVRLQFEMLSDAFQAQIKLDGVISAGAHGDFFPSEYGDSREVGI